MSAPYPLKHCFQILPAAVSSCGPHRSQRFSVHLTTLPSYGSCKGRGAGDLRPKLETLEAPREGARLRSLRRARLKPRTAAARRRVSTTGRPVRRRTWTTTIAGPRQSLLELRQAQRPLRRLPTMSRTTATRRRHQLTSARIRSPLCAICH